MSLIEQFKAELRNSQSFDSPIVLWGSLLTVGILLWSLLLNPCLQWRDQQQQQLSQQIRQASRLQALQKAAKDWQQATQSYQQAEQNMLAGLFQQTSYVTAQTALLKLLREEIKATHMIIDSQRLHESEPEPIIGQRISITLRLHGKLLHVLQLIHALSQHPKLLNMDKLYINRAQQERLTVTLQISGFRLANISAEDKPE